MDCDIERTTEGENGKCRGFERRGGAFKCCHWSELSPFPLCYEAHGRHFGRFGCILAAHLQSMSQTYRASMKEQVHTNQDDDTIKLVPVSRKPYYPAQFMVFLGVMI